MVMSRDVENRMLAEEDRVRKLADRDLIREILNTNAPDHPCVVEMLNRFYPGWENLNWDG